MKRQNRDAQGRQKSKYDTVCGMNNFRLRNDILATRKDFEYFFNVFAGYRNRFVLGALTRRTNGSASVFADRVNGVRFGVVFRRRLPSRWWTNGVRG